MRKHLLIICCIVLLGCSKNEPILPEPVSEAAITHITNDDLDLIDGAIQLTITKEEAIKRGVPASEYDLVAATLVRHNKGRAQTKAMNSTLAWGMLEYPATPLHNNSAGPLLVSPPSGSGITLNYTMGTLGATSHTLSYHVYGSYSVTDSVSAWSYGQGEIHFPGFEFGYMMLDYTKDGPDQGICVYDVVDGA